MFGKACLASFQNLREVEPQRRGSRRGDDAFPPDLVLIALAFYEGLDPLFLAC